MILEKRTIVYLNDRLLFFAMIISFGDSETLLTFQLHPQLYILLSIRVVQDINLDSNVLNL